jgi:hypothetical protein
MPGTDRLSRDDFQTQLLEHFHQPARPATVVELQQLLEKGLLCDYQMMAEYPQKSRLIAARLPEVAVRGEPEVRDLLALMGINVDRAFRAYQRSILELPRVAVAADGAPPPLRKS